METLNINLLDFLDCEDKNKNLKRLMIMFYFTAALYLQTFIALSSDKDIVMNHQISLIMLNIGAYVIGRCEEKTAN